MSESVKINLGAGGHKWMYDAGSLIHRLREAGFVEAERVAFREGRNMDVARLDTRSAFHLHAEAFKHPGR